MSTAFASRLEAGDAFQQELMKLLSDSSKVASVCANGTEHTHPGFVELLRSNTTPGSKFVRYAPDGVFLRVDGEVVHFDAKAAKSIEKDAYETYMGLLGLGCRVILFVKHDGRIFYADVQDVRLVDGNETVGKFRPERRWPVEDGWISPRLKTGFKPTGKMSGTPYREIDFSSMKMYGESK